METRCHEQIGSTCQSSLPAEDGDPPSHTELQFGDLTDLTELADLFVAEERQPEITCHFRIAKVHRLTPRVDVRKPMDAGAIVKKTKAGTARSAKLARALLDTLKCDESPASLLDAFGAAPRDAAATIATTLSMISTPIDDDFYSFGIGQVLKAGPRVAWLQHLVKCS